jgi:hypothetical protein
VIGPVISMETWCTTICSKEPDTTKQTHSARTDGEKLAANHEHSQQSLLKTSPHSD